MQRGPPLIIKGIHVGFPVHQHLKWLVCPGKIQIPAVNLIGGHVQRRLPCRIGCVYIGARPKERGQTIHFIGVNGSHGAVEHGIALRVLLFHIPANLSKHFDEPLAVVEQCDLFVRCELHGRLAGMVCRFDINSTG